MTSCWFATKDDVVCIADPSTMHKKHLHRIGVVTYISPHNRCSIQYGSAGPVLPNVSIFELIKVPIPLHKGIEHSGEFYVPVTPQS